MKEKDKSRLILAFAIIAAMESFSIVHGCSTNEGGSSSEISQTTKSVIRPTTKSVIRPTTRSVGRQTMDTPRTPVCPEHTCNDNKKCYTHAQQCDGFQDCDDNTDEDIGHCGKKLC